MRLIIQQKASGLTGWRISDIVRLMTYVLDIRARRQVTIPGDLLKTWNLQEGDGLILEIKDNQARLMPKKQSVKALLSEIQNAFVSSEFSEKEFQDMAANQRKRASKNIKFV